MRKVTSLVAKMPEFEGDLAREIRFPEWWDNVVVVSEDPFGAGKRIKLSADAQHQLLEVRGALKGRCAQVSQRLVRARSVATRAQLVGELEEIHAGLEWVQETLMESLSLLVLNRVNFAKRRRGIYSGSAVEDLVPEAYSCALRCMDVWGGEGLFSSYVGASIDAALSKNIDGNPGGGAMPESWQIALKHIPSLESELSNRLGRRPSDAEMREAYLGRAREFDRLRILEKGGEVTPDVLDELVHQRMKKRGTYAAAENMGALRSLCAGVVSLSDDSFGDLVGDLDVADFGGVDSSFSGVLGQIPGLCLDQPATGSVRQLARECLSTDLLAILCAEPLPVVDVDVSRAVPSALPIGVVS